MSLDLSYPTCYKCGLQNAALPLVYCLDCYAGLFGTKDLVGTTEIAERAGVQPDTVRKWLARHRDFPRPILMLAMGQVWRWDDVYDWITSRDVS